MVVRLPTTYVAEHVDLGYAITAPRAQGLTVDTAYSGAIPSMSRENQPGTDPADRSGEVDSTIGR